MEDKSPSLGAKLTTFKADGLQEDTLWDLFTFLKIKIKIVAEDGLVCH
jgi:hypothetical protein